MNRSNSIIARSEQEVKGLLQQALELAAKGYPVFPLRPSSKEPATTTGFHNATTDPEQIRQWWNQNPDYNIGIAAPELLVIDLDSYKPGATQSKEKLFGGFVPAEIPVVSTPSGGFHYYLRVDGNWAAEWGIGNNVDILHGIDLKGCGRGYVVGPGSVVDGRQYVLIGGWTELPPLAEVPMLPDQAMAALERARRRNKKTVEPNKNGHKPAVQLHQEPGLDDEERTRGLQLLAERLQRTWRVGRRHALALAVAGFLRKHGVPMEDAQALVRRVGSALQDEELADREAAVRDTYSKEVEEVAGLSLLSEEEVAELSPALKEFDWQPSNEPVSAEVYTQPTSWRERLKPISEIKSMSFPKLEWLVEGVIPARGLVVLAGRPKSGKSWLALDLVLSTAAGEGCLARGGTVRGTTIYLALEDTDARIKERSEIIGLSPADALIACSWLAADQGGYEELEDMVRNLRPKLVVVDTLAAFKAGTAAIRKPQFDIDYEQAKKLKSIADKYDCCVVVVAHTRKADADDVFDTVSGTLGLNAVADTIAILQHQRGSESGRLHVTGRDVSDEQYVLLFENGRWRITDMAEQEPESTRDKVLRGLKQWGPIRAKELHGLLEGVGFDALRQALRRLASDGLVGQDESGNYYVHGSSTHTEQDNRAHRVTLSHCHTVTLSRDNVTRDTRTRESWDEHHAQRVLAALQQAPATVVGLSELLKLELWQVRRGLMWLTERGAATYSDGMWWAQSEAAGQNVQGSAQEHTGGSCSPTYDPDAVATREAVAAWVLQQLLKKSPSTLSELGRSCPVYDGDYPLPLVVRDLCDQGIVTRTKYGLVLTDRGRAVASSGSGRIAHQRDLDAMV